MTTEQEQEDTLARIVCGDLDPDGHEARRLLAGEPALAARLDRLRRLAQHLDAIGSEETEVVRGAQASPPTAAEEGLAAQARARLRSRWRRTWLTLGALAAAAALILALVLWAPWRDGAPQVPDRLGPSAAPSAVAPTGRVSGRYGPLRYTGVSPPGAWFRFVVTASDGTAVADTGTEYQSASWAPDESGWPDEIAIEVQVHDPATGEVRTHRARAWR